MQQHVGRHPGYWLLNRFGDSWPQPLPDDDHGSDIGALLADGLSSRERKKMGINPKNWPTRQAGGYETSDGPSERLLGLLARSLSARFRGFSGFSIVSQLLLSEGLTLLEHNEWRPEVGIAPKIAVSTQHTQLGLA